MTAADFKGWLTHMGWSQREAARQLGKSKDTVGVYVKEGAPRDVALACMALACGLDPWPPKLKQTS